MFRSKPYEKQATRLIHKLDCYGLHTPGSKTKNLEKLAIEAQRLCLLRTEGNDDAIDDTVQAALDEADKAAKEIVTYWETERDLKDKSTVDRGAPSRVRGRERFAKAVVALVAQLRGDLQPPPAAIAGAHSFLNDGQSKLSGQTATEWSGSDDQERSGARSIVTATDPGGSSKEGTFDSIPQTWRKGTFRNSTVASSSQVPTGPPTAGA